MDHASTVPGQHLPGVKVTWNLRLFSARLGLECLAIAKEHLAQDQSIAVHQRDGRHFGEVDPFAKHTSLLFILVAKFEVFFENLLVLGWRRSDF